MDSWNPEQYKKFEKERNQPFFDLVDLVHPHKDMTVVDLGCGTGQLTKHLHDTLKAKSTIGIDASTSMLEQSHQYATKSLTFTLGNIDSYLPDEEFDLIFSNAALQWVPGHKILFSRFHSLLRSRGQLAIQMPYNMSYPTHVIAKALANEHPFKQEIIDNTHPAVLDIDDYSRILYELGFAKQNVRLQIYPHVLESTDSIVEWVKGSLLTHYQRQLSKEHFEQFLKIYTQRIKTHFGDRRPFFIGFRRLLMWAEKG